MCYSDMSNNRDILFAMRFSLSKLVVMVAFIFIFISTWLLFQAFESADNFTHTCKNSDEFMQNLHALSNRVHKALTRLGLTHYLCYGSLWGQIRMGKALPWQSDVELCLKNEELNHDEDSINKMFRSSGLNIAYTSSEGIYTVTDPALSGMKVELIVFEVDPMIEVSRRIGWKRRILPPDCGMVPSLHCFPPSLVESPLPTKKFGEFSMPVPRDGIEIQKYLYPNDWWKEIVPKNCNVK